MEVRRARRKSSQNRPFEFSDVRTMAGDEGAAGVSGLDGGSVVAQDGEQRKIRRAPRRVGDADIQRRRERMIADIRSAVASSAESRNGRMDLTILQRHVVDSTYA